MPKMDDIPEEFRDLNVRTHWGDLFADMFYHGLASLKLTPKEGVDSKKAFRHIRAIMKSWEPKHEHKTAAVTFLFSEWFSDAEWTTKDGKK
jgi:hypothetical protein